MKKFIAALLSCSCIMPCLFSCAADAPAESESSSKVSRISSAELDPAILGTWFGDVTGYSFQDDRKVTLVMDMSDSVKFAKDGSVTVQGVDLVDGDVNISDDKITISHHYDDFDETLDIMTLERTDNGKGLNGRYKMVSGSYIKLISTNLGMLPENVSIEAEINDGKFMVYVVDYCDFEANKGVLELFSVNMEYIDQNATSVKYTYTVDGDTLTLTYSDNTDSGSGLSEVLTRVKD